ncbi:hypothetical protein [Microbacterium sp. T2.11-28]|uniref:hypothetical protein n=1 Tax=Microbacterium sp. T2.11-28 TaxID=3041169 RepID=UPI0024773543|nr:hypothetical protein [Microbacterium sp. T2.11-28]CAI9389296.1 hypothetical protein MICABA_01049 [Microbacterium sp. T2.11-28]
MRGDGGGGGSGGDGSSGGGSSGGDLEIRAGGLIAVDTGTLRHVAGVLDLLAAECAAVSALLRRAGLVSREGGLLLPDPAGTAEEAEERAAALARALRHRAEVYERIERHAARALDELHAGADTVAVEAAALWDAWRDGRHAEVGRQLSGAVAPLWMAAALLGGVGGLIRIIDRGTIRRDDPPLVPAARTTVVTELARSEVSAPRTLAEVAARIPGGGDDRVLVETYETAPGRREHVVYIAGTKDLGTPYAEPWDMASNGELYLGQASSSYDATGRALAAAGALAGDRIHLVGHSQGAMIATRFARESGYDVGTLITFASPIEAELDDVLTVTVRHTDDPVVALSAGGVPVAGGAPGSFVVERVADPQPRVGDLALGVHHMDAYRRTAAMVDASDDPRVDAVRAHLAGLASAGAATAIVYGARRDHGTPATAARRGVSGASAGGGG